MTTGSRASLERRSPTFAIPALLAFAGLCVLLTSLRLTELLPLNLWWSALIAPDTTHVGQLLFHHSALPRVAVSIVAGAALGLAGAIFQQTLRNPLAEPATVGTAAGANLALGTAAILAPFLLETGRELVAIGGGALATAAVILIAWRRHLSPVLLVLAGLVVSLVCGSASALLVVLDRDYMTELFIWQTGSLIQNGTAVATNLSVKLLIGFALATSLIRPMRILELDDESTRSLGFSPAVLRLAGLAVAVWLSAAVVAAVGVIGFVGLAAPHIAGALGARTFTRRMVAASAGGALLLWFTDQLVQVLPLSEEVPTGTATALIGAPLLLLLLPRMRAIMPTQGGTDIASPRHVIGWWMPFAATATIAVTIALSLFFARGIDGWHWASAAELATFLPLRLPRALVALSGGAILAVSGTLIQRMTGNPMASPEVLGISSGAAIGIILLFLIGIQLDRTNMILAAAAGALLTLGAIVLMAARASFSPDHILLAGISLSAIGTGLAALVLASGDPRIDFLLAWLSGSNYRATLSDAATAGCILLVTLAGSPLMARWLEILPLGQATSISLGIPLKTVRLSILLAAGLCAAAATVFVGPLSFVGLIAPRAADYLGYHRPLPQLFVSAFLGGVTMAVADWLSRTIIFPWQVPVGLLVALVGGPFFLWQIAKRR
ncbi:Fe(3+)-hydroxamate ABC transporter permease FhuB [Neorhizobium galegae]|uniref:Iron-hydroxamate transporter, permease subunit n=1 Tax=Neorhizobium galegae bv. officinalis TaxID=323656 RepID=A0A0T7GXG5_NEOGA|nr:Fe(3+)-hydroxamate ABC transporter permease FhuB [Neorhizobium galegae]CDZ51933.1 Iron-hydroxamate transporter, permease subunit [Neorhizobium galegae bv. officinalis]